MGSMKKQTVSSIVSVTGIFLLLAGVLVSMFLEPGLRYVLTAPFVATGFILATIGLNYEIKYEEKKKHDNNKD